MSHCTIIPAKSDLHAYLLHAHQAPKESLTRTVYNVQGMSFAPKDLAAAIQKHHPHFKLICKPDFRAAIARSW